MSDVAVSGAEGPSGRRAGQLLGGRFGGAEGVGGTSAGGVEVREMGKTLKVLSLSWE